MDWATFLANPNTGIGAALLVFIIAIMTGRVYSRKAHNELIAIYKEQAEKADRHNELLEELLKQKNLDKP